MKTEQAKEQGSIAKETWDKLTGRSRYFKPEPNKDYKLVITGWKVIEMGLKGDQGLGMKVISVNGKPIENEEGFKEWNTTSKRILRQLQPIIMKAEEDGHGEIQVVFRKSLGKGEKDTEAKFTVEEVENGR